MANIEKC